MVYLIDASALVLFFLKDPPRELVDARRRMMRLLASAGKDSGRKCFVPNFCMAECSKAFSRLCIKPDGAGVSEYRRMVGGLLDLVSSGKQGVVRSYELRREHLVDIEDIFIADRRLAPRSNEKPLSGLDALVISMGRTLAQAHPDFCLITAERRMAHVCQRDGALPKAVCIIRDEIPGT